jgi:hypothetical protein
VSGDEAAAWRRLVERMEKRGAASGARRLWLAGATMVAAAVAVVLLSRAQRSDRQPLASPVTIPAPIASSTPTASQSPLAPGATARLLPSSAEQLALSTTPKAVPVGEVDLDDQARIHLYPGGRALASTDAGNIRVSVVHGTARFDVQPQAPGRRFQVELGPYRFVVIGTSFRVVGSTRSVDLWVLAGRVAVWRGERLEGVVAPGGHWVGALATAAETATDHSGVAGTEPHDSSSAPQSVVAGSGSEALANPAPLVTPPVDAVGPSEPLAPCEAYAGAGRLRDALECYRRIGDGRNLGAELALYEAARIERSLGDARAALQSLNEYLRRFPNGTLRAEVDLTRVELLPRAGQHQQALEESERILNSGPDPRRAQELHLLRGNIYREALHDCENAEPEYRLAARGMGRAADEAEFYGAVCLELMGHRDEATGAYRAYLRRAHAAHLAEARNRLEGL